MDVAIVRLEQLFPLPHKEIQDQLLRYTNVDDVVWAQGTSQYGCMGLFVTAFA